MYLLLNLTLTHPQLMWWIFADNDPDPPVEYEIPNFVIANGDNANPPPRNPDFAPIGHIALDAIDYAAPDPKQRVGEEGTMFVSLSAHDRRGIREAKQ